MSNERVLVGSIGPHASRDQPMPTVKGSPRTGIESPPTRRGDMSPPYQQATDRVVLNNVLLLLGSLGNKVEELASAVKVLELSHMLQMEEHKLRLAQLTSVLMNLRPMLTVERFGADAQGFVDLFPASYRPTSTSTQPQFSPQEERYKTSPPLPSERRESEGLEKGGGGGEWGWRVLCWRG